MKVKILFTSLFTLLLIYVSLLGLVVKAETPIVFEKFNLDINGEKILVFMERLGEPDVIIRYCGVNYVYFKPTGK